MLNTRVIFFDGLPGSGKTSLTNWLSEVLSSMGIQNTAYEEQCNSHPLRINVPLYTDLTSIEQSAEFRSRTIDLFRKFVDRKHGGDSISIFDSLLFQNVIGWAYLCRMHSSDVIDFGFRLFDVLRDLDPVLIYIGQTDVERNWRRICDIRGPEWASGTCGITEDFDFIKAGIAWSGIQKYCLAMIEKASPRSLIIMNTDYDFDSHRARIADYLDLQI